MTTTTQITTNPLRDARRKKGITQSVLADRLGVTKGAVSAWESDNANPTVDKLAALGRVLRPHLNLNDYLRHVDGAAGRDA
ncbi:MAG: helix-turn-helix transcriptional regulator [Pseudoxanthomonas sp.]